MNYSKIQLIWFECQVNHWTNQDCILYIHRFLITKRFDLIHSNYFKTIRPILNALHFLHYFSLTVIFILSAEANICLNKSPVCDVFQLEWNYAKNGSRRRGTTHARHFANQASQWAFLTRAYEQQEPRFDAFSDSESFMTKSVCLLVADNLNILFIHYVQRYGFLWNQNCLYACACICSDWTENRLSFVVWQNLAINLNETKHATSPGWMGIEIHTRRSWWKQWIWH